MKVTITTNRIEIEEHGSVVGYVPLDLISAKVLRDDAYRRDSGLPLEPTPARPKETYWLVLETIFGKKPIPLALVTNKDWKGSRGAEEALREVAPLVRKTQPSANIPPTHIRYIQASGIPSITDPYNTVQEGDNIRPAVTFERREYTINSTGTGSYLDLPNLLPLGGIRDTILVDTNGDPITPDDVDISDPLNIVVTIATGGAPTELVFTLAPLDEFSLGDDPDGWTITPGYDIEYTTITDDGASGTWEYSINGGSWTPVGSSLDLTGMAGDVIKVRRSVSTGAGWLKLEP